MSMVYFSTLMRRFNPFKKTCQVYSFDFLLRVKMRGDREDKLSRDDT
jgi:hypothetical protein